MRLSFLLALLLPALPALGQAPDSTATQAADTLHRPDRKLNSALVVGARQKKVENAAMGLNYLRPEHIRSIPTLLGEADIVKALQMQPGVSPGLEGFAGMMVRGGNDDQNLFLIDGNPIYQSNHFGGLFSSYNIEAVRDVAFYKAAFPARYGGRLSSVVDLNTRPGDVLRYGGSFSIGLTAANLAFNGPIVKNRSSFNIALRRSWFDLLTTPILALYNADTKHKGEKNHFAYAFTDFNLQLNHRFDRWGTLAFTGYYGNDRLAMETENWNPHESSGINYWHDKGGGSMSWGNLLAALKWQLPLGEGWLQSLTAAFTRYGSTIRAEEESSRGTPNEWGYEHFEMMRQMSNGIKDYSLRSQWLWTGWEPAKVRLGMDYTYHHFTPEQLKERNSFKTTPTTFANEDAQAHDLSAYVDGEWQVLPWWQVQAGLRLSDFWVQGKNYLEWEPRFSTNVRLTPSLSLKGSYARMSQYVQQVSDAFIALPTDYWVPITQSIRPLTSHQFSIGGYYSWHNRWNFSIEAWHKSMNHLLEYREGYDLLSTAGSWSSKLTTGHGTAKGIDFQVEKNFGRLAGFLGYGLLWSDRQFAENNGGKPYPSKYDNRHKLNLALSFRVSPRFEMNAAWTYMSGSRVTISFESYEPATHLHPDAPQWNTYASGAELAYLPQKNNFTLPDYHRLDVGFNFYRPHKRSKRTSIWSVSFYNAYSKMNPILLQKKERVHFTPQPDGSYEAESKLVFQSVSLFPIIPSISYTLKF